MIRGELGEENYDQNTRLNFFKKKNRKQKVESTLTEGKNKIHVAILNYSEKPFDKN